MKAFFDTSVLVRLFDGAMPDKQIAARALFARHARAGDFLLSVQVLQEFYNAVTALIARPLAATSAVEAVSAFAELSVAQVDTRLVLAAARRSQTDQLVYRDALIVETALMGGASVLYSEELTHGREFGALRVENPFLGMA